MNSILINDKCIKKNNKRDNKRDNKRNNFDGSYYRNKYFMYGLKNNEDAINHWEKIGYKKGLFVSICDEMKVMTIVYVDVKIKMIFQLTN